MCYDIGDQKRLKKVHAFVLGFGSRQQYSVFVCDLNDVEKVRLKTGLRTIINERVDKVAIIDLGETMGRGGQCWEFLGIRDPLPSTGPLIV